MIASGHFDISVGAIVGLCTCVMAIMIINGVNELVVFITGVALAALCCLLNRALSIALNAPSFIITMATTGIYTGIGLLLTKGVLQMITGKFRFFPEQRYSVLFPLWWSLRLSGMLSPT